LPRFWSCKSAIKKKYLSFFSSKKTPPTLQKQKEESMKKSAQKKTARVSAAFFAVLFAFLFIFSSMPIYADYEKSVYSPHAAVYNTENGVFIFEKAAEERIQPASTAKIMTGIIALEYFSGNLDREITVIYSAVRGLEGSTTMNLKVGEVVTVRQLLYGLLVGGANDAAQVLAFEISKANAMFAVMMTERAKALGATNTLYKNPMGFDDVTAYTTARDVAIISAYAYSMPEFMKICETKKYEMPATNKSNARTIWTRNHLISNHNQIKYIYSKAKGISAGQTESGGYCIVSGAESSFNYICVVMGGTKNDKGDITAYYDVRNLLDWALDAYEMKKAVSEGTVLWEIPVSLCDEYSSVTLAPASAVYAYLPKDFDMSKIELRPHFDKDSIEAPAEKGTSVGTLTVTVDGKEVGSTKIVTKYSVRKSDSLAAKAYMKKMLGSPFFVIAVISLILAAVIFTLVRIYIYMKKASIRK
jgi:D-alanyl-D-alanine carboxypeptidase (penicillin-binding protein 5/6)